MEIANLTSADEELLYTWLAEFKQSPLKYIEPLLDSSTVDLIKYACDILKQDSHVFIMTVDILTKYIMIMNDKNVEIEDQLLTVLTIICICSKYIGELSELKFLPVAKLYETLTQRDVPKGTLKHMEMRIFETLNERLPMYSTIDDLKVLVHIYVQKFNLRVDICKLCVEVLDVVYIFYRRLFYKLLNVYKQNPGAAEAFKDIVTNRLYLPSGVFFCSLKLTKLPNVINLDKLLNEVSKLADIHRNHIELLTTYILDVINRRDE